MRNRAHVRKAAIISMIFFILIFGAYANSYAKSHYVDKSANGANDGTSWSNAWESFGSINWSSVAAGDTVYISGGSSSKTYYETLSIGSTSGTSSKPITITKGQTSGHNGKVVIDGSDSRSNGISSRGSGKNYFIIKNFTVRNHTAQEIRVENSIGTVIRDIIIPNSECTGIRFRYNTNCTISNISYDSVDSGATSTTDGIFIQDCRNTTIEYNYIEITNEDTGSHDDCFQQGAGTSWAGGGTFRGNYCNQDNRDTVNSQGFFWEDAKGTWNIYNNVVDGHNYVKNLINFKNARSSAVLNIYNNTVIGGSYQEGNPIRIQAAEYITLNMKNNIGYSTSSNHSLVNLSGSMNDNIDYNIWHCPNNSYCYDGSSWSGWKSRGFDNNGFNSNPRLNSNYMISSTDAPGYDAGTYISLFSYDKDGVSRPQGTRWDIGAYEFESGGGGGETSSEQPSAPTNLRLLSN